MLNCDDETTGQIKRLKLFWAIALVLTILSPDTFLGQDVTLTENAEYEFVSGSPFLLYSSFTTHFDKNNSDILYSANMHIGLGVYDLSTSGTITPIVEFGPDQFDGLLVTHLDQEGDFLAVSLGNFQSDDHDTGMALLDVSDPLNPTITDVWTSADYRNGSADLLIEGDYAYLAAMNDGLIILDISDKSDIKFVSQILPDINFPVASNGEHHQSRGLTYRDDKIYLVVDRGGFRVIDVSDRANPVEVEKYLNEDIRTGAAAAYNDVFLKDNFAFVSVDYCGMEVLDMSTEPFTNILWYDPVSCDPNFGTWNGADVHTNEMIGARNSNLLFVSGGNSELLVFDISDPSSTHLIGDYGALDDETAAYGLDVVEGQVALGLVSVFLNIPYVANWGGIKLLDWDATITDVEHDFELIETLVYPNPAIDHVTLQFESTVTQLDVFDLSGRKIYSSSIDTSDRVRILLSEFPNGMYVARASGLITERHQALFVVQD